MDILLTCGLGDCICLDSMMTEREKNSLETIWWCSRTARINADLFRQAPRYRHVQHKFFDVQKIYMNETEVRAEFPLPDHVEDWSIIRIFPTWADRPYSPSTFWNQQRPYLIQDSTPVDNGPSYRDLGQSYRDLDDAEWALILARLEEENLMGVVVNSADARHPPEHPRIIDLVGKTNLGESIALLRHAMGYLGIGSWLSVLAAQIFQPSELLVKNPEGWLWLYRTVYFSPQKTMPFLKCHLLDKP